LSHAPPQAHGAKVGDPVIQNAKQDGAEIRAATHPHALQTPHAPVQHAEPSIIPALAVVKNSKYINMKTLIFPM
jgi:hypothetical protein